MDLANTNSHFLCLAHAVHVRAVGRGSFLVNIIVVSEGGANDFGVLFVVNGHCCDALQSPLETKKI